MNRWLIISLVLVACGGTPGKPAPTAPANNNNEPLVDEVPAEELEPLPSSKEVQLLTEDGVAIIGTLYASAARQADADASDGAIVLVHQLDSKRSEWDPFVAELAATHTVLTIDLRGHGESLVRDDGSILDWNNFSEEDWSSITLDVRAAVAYLRDLLPTPAAISLAGGSIGSSAVLLYAAEDPEIYSVAALSPGLKYRGLATEAAVRALAARPGLLMATRGDRRSAKAARRLARLAPGTRAIVYRGKGHGVSMDGEAREDTIRFLAQTPTQNEPKPVNADE